MSDEKIKRALAVVHYSKDEWIVIDGFRDEVLCQGIKCYPWMVWYPIKWVTHKDAETWAKRGHIAEIQEGHGNLKVYWRPGHLVKYATADADYNGPIIATREFYKPDDEERFAKWESAIDEFMNSPLGKKVCAALDARR